MQVGENNGMFWLSEYNPPISIHFDRFHGFGEVASIGKADIEVTDGLTQLIVHVKGIVPGINFVKINEMSKEDIGPQVVWEYQTPWVIDDLGFASFDVKMIVSFELECEFKSWVQCSMSGCEIPPCKE